MRNYNVPSRCSENGPALLHRENGGNRAYSSTTRKQKMKIDIKTFNFEFASKFTQSLRTQDRENGFPVNI